MRRVELLEFPESLACSVALTRDLIRTANRVALTLGHAPPFAGTEARIPNRTGDLPGVLILPGMGCIDEAELTDFLASAAAQRALDRVRAAAAAGALLVSSCAGVALLAEAGVLDGRRATTSWFLMSALTRRYPRVRFRPTDMVVEDGPCLTGGAALAQGDVMLALLRRIASPTVADLTGRYLLLDQRRSQTPYLSVSVLATSDPLLQRAETWIRGNLPRGFDISDLAAALGLTPWTLARRIRAATGLSPTRLVDRLRADEARQRLAGGERIGEVARDLGYTDPSALRRLLKRAGAPDPKV